MQTLKIIDDAREGISRSTAIQKILKYATDGGVAIVKEIINNNRSLHYQENGFDWLGTMELYGDDKSKGELFFIKNTIFSNEEINRCNICGTIITKGVNYCKKHFSNPPSINRSSYQKFIETSKKLAQAFHTENRIICNRTDCAKLAENGSKYCSKHNWNHSKTCSRVDCILPKLHGSRYCAEHALSNFTK